MSRAREPWVILARMQRRAAHAGVVLAPRRAQAAVDRLRAQAADPLADRVHRQRFDTAGPCRESVCACRGGGPHAPGCPVYEAERRAELAELGAGPDLGTRAADRPATWHWCGEFHGWLWDCGCLVGAERLYPAATDRCSRCDAARPGGPPDDRQPLPLPADGTGWR